MNLKIVSYEGGYWCWVLLKGNGISVPLLYITSLSPIYSVRVPKGCLTNILRVSYHLQLCVTPSLHSSSHLPFTLASEVGLGFLVPWNLNVSHHPVRTLLVSLCVPASLYSVHRSSHTPSQLAVYEHTKSPPYVPLLLLESHAFTP